MEEKGVQKEDLRRREGALGYNEEDDKERWILCAGNVEVAIALM